MDSRSIYQYIHTSIFEEDLIPVMKKNIICLG